MIPVSLRLLTAASVTLLLATSPASSQAVKQKSPATPKQNAPAPSAAAGRAYLSQAFVDSAVNQAFFELSEGASAGEGSRQQLDGINRAKAVAAHMLEIGKGDPNEKYVRWRVGELRKQIFLEDQALRELRAKERQIVVNHLVASYNAEVGKPRPDFAQLAADLKQLETVDPLKANEMEASMADRRRNIGREVLAKIERSLDAGDADVARRELDYCDVNQKYLSIPLTKYGQLTAKARVKMNTQQERTAVAEYLKRGERLLASDSLGGAADAAAEARSRCASIRQDLSPQEYDRTAARWQRVLAEVDKREDRLVAQNLDLLNTRGIDAALAFLNTDLARYRISREKIATVNNAVIAALLAQRRLAEKDSAANREVAALVNSEGTPGLNVESLTAAAKKRAQVRADSIRTAESKKLTWRERRALKRKQREEEEARAKTPPRPHRTFTLASASEPEPESPAVTSPPPVVTPATEPIRDPQLELQAKDRLINIYLLLEQNKTGQARGEFLSNQAFLQANLIPEAFDALRGAVDQSSSGQSSAQ